MSQSHYSLVVKMSDSHTEGRDSRPCGVFKDDCHFKKNFKRLFKIGITIGL